MFQVRAPATHSSPRSARTSPNSVSSPNFSLTLSPSLSASLSPHITQAVLDDLDFDVQFEQTFLAQQKAVSMPQLTNNSPMFSGCQINSVNIIMQNPQNK